MDALIIEDELPALKHLKQVLEATGKITVVGSAESISESIDWFKNNVTPDLVFMDIHLADGLAFEIFNHVQVNCPIIFTTAYDEYALKAFKVNSVDYLLKPVDLASVNDALRKIRTLSSGGAPDSALSKLINTFVRQSRYKNHFLIPTRGDKLLPVRVSDLACFYIDAGTVRALSFEEKTFRFDYTLDELTEMLDPEVFFRANRQYIISRYSVRDIDLWFNNRLSVNLKVTVPEKILISKARISEFKNWFGA